MIKVGIIGLGGIGNVHIGKLSEIKDVSIEAVCDMSRELVKQQTEKLKTVRGYTDHYEMLSKEKLDCLYLCFPPFAHTDQAILAANKGINIFVEKPVALTLKKAKEIEKVILKNKVINSVGYCCRYLDIVDKIKELIKGKKIAMATGKFHTHFQENPFWWRIKSMSGGQLIEQTTHVLDMLRYLIGDVDRVFGFGYTGINKYDKYDIDDATIGLLHFEKGAIGSVSSLCIDRKGFDRTIEIFVKDIEIHLLQWSKIKVLSNNGEEEINANCDMYALEDNAFIEAVKNKKQSLIKSSYSDAVKTLGLTLAIDKAIRTGKTKVIK